MKASPATTIVALAIAGLNTAAARFSGFELTCKWINYTNLIGNDFDKRSVIMEALCDRLYGHSGPQLTMLDLKTCLGWDPDKCNFVAPPRNTTDAFTRWCPACSIGTGVREGHEIHPSLDCDCHCSEGNIGKAGGGSISLSKCTDFFSSFSTIRGPTLLTKDWQALISAITMECLSAELESLE